MAKHQQNLFIPETKWALSKESYLMHAPFLHNLMLGKINASVTQRNVAASVRFAVDANGKKIHRDFNDLPPNSVGVVNIRGLMIRYGNWYMWGADELVQMLEFFDNHPNVIGTVLVKDTGGGEVSAAGPYLNFFENKKKPVVSLADSCGSLGVMVQSACDYRMAENNFSSFWGSVGIMAHFTSYAKYYKDLGIEEHTIYSDLSEHKNEGFDLAMEGKYDLIKKDDLNPMAQKFQDHVKLHIPKLKHEEIGVLTGKTFYADKALELNAIQEIGNMNRAVQMVHLLSEANNMQI
jgi:protease-4